MKSLLALIAVAPVFWQKNKKKQNKTKTKTTTTKHVNRAFSEQI